MESGRRFFTPDDANSIKAHSKSTHTPVPACKHSHATPVCMRRNKFLRSPSTPAAADKHHAAIIPSLRLISFAKDGRAECRPRASITQKRTPLSRWRFGLSILGLNLGQKRQKFEIKSEISSTSS